MHVQYTLKNGEVCFSRQVGETLRTGPPGVEGICSVVWMQFWVRFGCAEGLDLP